MLPGPLNIIFRRLCCLVLLRNPIFALDIITKGWWLKPPSGLQQSHSWTRRLASETKGAQGLTMLNQCIRIIDSFPPECPMCFVISPLCASQSNAVRERSCVLLTFFLRDQWWCFDLTWFDWIEMYDERVLMLFWSILNCTLCSRSRGRTDS